MPQYKCIHESILRKGTFRNPPFFTGKQPVTSPWNPSLLAVEWYEPLSVWQTDCSYASCGVSQEDTVCTGGGLKKNLKEITKKSIYDNNQIIHEEEKNENNT
jgi:hypothetical protein